MDHDPGIANSGRPRHDIDEVARLATARELVGAITHDLRQPLTAMSMNVAAAIRLLTQSPPRLREAIEALGDALIQQRRMGEALQVLEDLANRREPYRHAFDVVALVREVMSLVRSDALARNVAVELTVRGDVPPIEGDVTLVRHALLNVILQALEVTSMSKREQAAVSVAVASTGAFTEVSIRHPVPAPGAAGADGAGLTLARSVVDAHAATFVVNNDPDTGAMIVMRWPVRHRVSPLSSGGGK